MKLYEILEDRIISESYQEYEEMKDRLATVFIKLYDGGKDWAAITAMSSQIAAKLGYNPNDKTFLSAFRSSLTDVASDREFEEPDNDYTDWSMHQGEMRR